MTGHCLWSSHQLASWWRVRLTPRFTFALTAFSTWHNASAVARKSLAQRFSAGLVLYLNMSPVGTAQIAVSAVPTALGFCMPNAFCDPEKLAIQIGRASCRER